MSRRLDHDPDFEFFNPDLSLDGMGSPGMYLGEDFATEPSPHFSALASPKKSQKTQLPDQTQFLESGLRQSISATSTTSPAASYQDSSSESSGYKRKSSSDSSRSAMTSGGDMIMADDAGLSSWKMDGLGSRTDTTHFVGYDGTINPHSMDNTFEFNDKTMENDFDFDSAASSPSPFGAGSIDMGSPEIKYEPPYKRTATSESRARNRKSNSQHSRTHSVQGAATNRSREASPLSAMITSQHSSPSALFSNSSSPSAGVEFISGTMLNGVSQAPLWPAQQHYTSNSASGVHNHGPNTRIYNKMNVPMSFQSLNAPYKPVLTIHPTPLKSRVETQIPIKLTLFPMPIGVTKLHLPTHTISKPKLLAKPPPERTPDTLELYTTLVCTSAMQNPEYRRRAFERAAASNGSQKTEIGEVAGDEDEENKPLNGGEVKICAGCITRERKRAARKKIKKVEEEESWHKDEHRRVIVFNTYEIKEWQAPSAQIPSELMGDRPEPMVPEGAMQVDAPMRIACYCRHQNEKLGFQVIFTIKDHQDRLIAQEITSSIMITDDHKTHNILPIQGQQPNGSDAYLQAGSGGFSTEGIFEAPAGNGTNPFRISHSSSDLQSLQRNVPVQYQPPVNLTTPLPPQNPTMTITPRNLSRQVSPSPSAGPTSKKRKASGSSKVPSGLAMTRLETGPTGASPGGTAGPSPFTPNQAAFPLPNEHQFAQPSMNMPNMLPQYNAGPPTPNSNDQVFFSGANRSQSVENLAMQQMYSAPASAHASRAPSPSGLRNAYQQQQAQIAQAVANGLYGIPLGLNPHRPPTIHKLIPNEGPKAGGIEVTCLGSGFCQGLEVMFGDCKATTTTFWGETSLVCLLPPSAFAGTVPVTFKHQHQQQMQPFGASPIPKHQAYFKYVDDDEQQIIRTALSVLGHKMTGKMEDVRELARRIVGDGASSWGAGQVQSPVGGSQHQQVSGFSAATFGVDVEATLLRCLDLIDLDDSPHTPRLNLRRASGQTMLHMACSLGLHRFVAALLARGAHPEPRDKGGFTPMHFAALHNHPQIVRRLILYGADPTVRSLQGYTPGDMATSEEVFRATRRIEHHTRTRSGSSLRSRANSATSLRSVWGPTSVTSAMENLDLTTSGDDNQSCDSELSEEDQKPMKDRGFWMRSRHSSSQKKLRDPKSTSLLQLPDVNPAAGIASPSAAMIAFRDQVTAHIQQLQQNIHLNLPNLPQMLTLPPIPGLPDYQAYLPSSPMVRRISSLVGSNRPENSNQDYRWWDLFSGTLPTAPPAYEDIFPGEDISSKKASVVQAAADTIADNKCAEIFDQAESSTASRSNQLSLDTVRIGQKHTITKEQQERLRLAHAERIKKIRSDRNLFFVWIPLLVVISLAMLYNRVPKLWANMTEIVETFRRPNRNQATALEA
ncbi:hypothetical protein F5884DRAFT_658075 [Xylogone sp. PMI_703]|nr:hypothetical protein F5884DRAFT_658075 [Xylogone sp. PMI_703]